MPGRRVIRYLSIAAICVFTIIYLSPPSPFLSTGPRYSASSQPIEFVPSSYNWTAAKLFFPPASPLTSLPTGKPKTLPKVQHASLAAKPPGALNDKRRRAVRYVFVRAWNSYKQQAWLSDELRPVTGGARETFGGWAATLVDALDTLWIMGLESDFRLAARAACALDFGNTTARSANMFETTIRHLGGLLAAYDLSREPALLRKAVELGDMLYMGFDTPNRLPGFWLDFENARTGRQVAGTHDPSASPASLSLEFTRLAQLTGDAKYYDAVDRVRAFLDRIQNSTLLPGMWPTAINFREEDATSDNSFTLGALADSLYEYLPKMFILSGGLEPSYEKMYRDSMEVARKYLLFRPMLPEKDDILFAGNARVFDDRVDVLPEGQHLACFVGGMFLLGGKTFGIEEHLKTGERVARGCAWAYSAFPTGLMPELFNMITCPSQEPCEWDEAKWQAHGDKRLKKGFRNARDPRYILRPEAIESIFLLYRITGQEELREVAWTMFESVVKATRTPLANSAISDVTVEGETTKLDSMEVRVATPQNE